MLNRLQKFSYGIARLGSSILLGLFGWASVYVYWGYYNLDPVLTGWANAAGKIVIAVAGFFMGYISDITKTRWGKRKPYIIFGAPLLALAFYMYFIPHHFLGRNVDQFTLFIYAAFFNSLFHFSYAFLLTPFQAWMPEITEPEERIGVSALQNFSNLLANAISVVIGFLLPSILRQDGLALIVLGILAIFEVLLYFPSILFIPKETKTVLQPNFIKDMKIIISNKEYMKWVMVQGLVSVSMTMTLSLVLTYIEKVIGITGGLASLSFGIILLIVIVGFFYVWGRMAKKKGKGKTLFLTNMIFMIALLLTPIIGLMKLPFPSYVLGYLFIVLGAMGASGFQLFPYVIIADLAHKDEIDTGENRAGLYTGFNSIPLNIFQTFAYILTGYILTLPNVPGRGYTSGLLWWGPIAAIFTLLGNLVLLKTNIDPFMKRSKL